MEPGMNEKLDELLVLTKENNQMLHKMRRIQRWSTAFKVFYWIIIIGVTAGAFIFLQPYVDQIKSFGSSLPQPADVQAFFSQVGGK